jgi:two-component system, LytTR family, response regulator
MIRTVIIDDEPNNIEALKQLLLKYCPLVELTGVAENIRTGQALILHTQPDLVFLDIEMPYGNAFELLNSLSPVNFEIIFVTAFDNYAINAIKYSALDYLLKPVNIKELQSAVQKAADRIKTKNITRKIDTLLYNLKVNKPALQKVALPTLEGLVFVNINELVWLEARGSYTFVYMQDQQKIMVSRTLKEFEDILPAENFSRVHQSYIINHFFIKKYNRGRGGTIEMEDGTTIEVSMRKKDEFLSKFK